MTITEFFNKILILKIKNMKDLLVKDYGSG